MSGDLIQSNPAIGFYLANGGNETKLVNSIISMIGDIDPDRLNSEEFKEAIGFCYDYFMFRHKKDGVSIIEGLNSGEITGDEAVKEVSEALNKAISDNVLESLVKQGAATCDFNGDDFVFSLTEKGLELHNEQLKKMSRKGE
jgi:hypothetical protein